MNKLSNKSLQAIKARFVYDPEQGTIVHTRNAHPYHRAGDSALRDKVDRWEVRCEGVFFTAAAVAWFLHYGEWPGGHVGFRDGDRKNLKINNLALKQELVKERLKKNCKVCGKEFLAQRGAEHTAKYCSRICYSRDDRRKLPQEEKELFLETDAIYLSLSII